MYRYKGGEYVLLSVLTNIINKKLGYMQKTVIAAV